jgi:signal transduction histidine kinase
MEAALSDLSRKLIESQEQERGRIGRELHDDINQRLAMLAAELGQLQENPSDVRSRVQELQRRTIEISSDVQALSHELHSSKLLEYLGVVGGIKSWCREFEEDREYRSISFEFCRKPCTTTDTYFGCISVLPSEVCQGLS